VIRVSQLNHIYLLQKMSVPELSTQFEIDVPPISVNLAMTRMKVAGTTNGNIVVTIILGTICALVVC
jgi:hypothetical protein